jgi:hypothetical protein
LHTGEQNEKDARGRAIRIYGVENFGLTQSLQEQSKFETRAISIWTKPISSISAIAGRLRRPSGATMLAPKIAKTTLHVGRQRSVQTAHNRVQLTVLRQYRDLLVQAKYLFDENAKFASSGFDD